jgi:hypothetical protein
MACAHLRGKTIDDWRRNVKKNDITILVPARVVLPPQITLTAMTRFAKVPPVLAQYLPDGAYHFSMAFRRGTFSEFWGATQENADILHERRRWLSDDESRYLAFTPSAHELLEEAIRLGRENGTLPQPPGHLPSRARWLGEHWEPDYLLLEKTAGEPRLVCGCVCFPSSWALEEKIGRPISEIHDVVPALNATIGRQIHTFLARLRPGVSWLRSNWGLSRSPERNQHPARRIPRLDPLVPLDQVYFRVEEQSLVALPQGNGILFGIRLVIFPLQPYAGTPEGAKLAEALETMPELMAHYKGLASTRTRLVQLLRGMS